MTGCVSPIQRRFIATAYYINARAACLTQLQSAIASRPRRQGIDKLISVEHAIFKIVDNNQNKKSSALTEHGLPTLLIHRKLQGNVSRLPSLREISDAS